MRDSRPRVLVYTLPGCVHCVNARRILERADIPFEECNGTGVPGFRAILAERTGRSTVPHVVIRGEPIGRASELARLARRGVLVARVNGDPFPVGRVRRRLSPRRLVATMLTAPFGDRCGPWRHVLELRDRDGRLLQRETLPFADHAGDAERLLGSDARGRTEATVRSQVPGRGVPA